MGRQRKTIGDEQEVVGSERRCELILPQLRGGHDNLYGDAIFVINASQGLR